MTTPTSQPPSKAQAPAPTQSETPDIDQGLGELTQYLLRCKETAIEAQHFEEAVSIKRRIAFVNTLTAQLAEATKERDAERARREAAEEDSKRLEQISAVCGNAIKLGLTAYNNEAVKRYQQCCEILAPYWESRIDEAIAPSHPNEH